MGARRGNRPRRCGRLGLELALEKLNPDTRHQLCWAHKAANVVSKLPDRLELEANHKLRQIWMAESGYRRHNRRHWGSRLLRKVYGPLSNVLDERKRAAISPLRPGAL